MSCSISNIISRSDVRSVSPKLESNKFEFVFYYLFFVRTVYTVANSAGGCAYEREVLPPDWILDYWHPLEKAQYPEYFARREQRKKEYVAWWEKQYGKHDPSAHHH